MPPLVILEIAITVVIVLVLLAIYIWNYIIKSKGKDLNEDGVDEREYQIAVHSIILAQTTPGSEEEVRALALGSGLF